MLGKKGLANTFSLDVERMVRDENISYMEAIVFSAHAKNLEPEAVVGLINDNLKDKLEAEARELNI